MEKSSDFVIPAERLKLISDYIEQRGNAKISDLAAELNVSESTVRRDLDLLVQEGLIQRSHGGATWIRHSSSYEHIYSEKMLIRGEEKKKLTVDDLLQKFSKASGDELDNDRMLLS